MVPIHFCTIHHTGELFRRLGRCDKTADAPLLDLIRLEPAVTKTLSVVRNRFELSVAQTLWHRDYEPISVVYSQDDPFGPRVDSLLIRKVRRKDSLSYVAPLFYHRF